MIAIKKSEHLTHLDLLGDRLPRSLEWVRFLRGLLERLLFLEFDRRRDLLLDRLQSDNLPISSLFSKYKKPLHLSSPENVHFNYLCLERDLDLLLLDLDLVRDRVRFFLLSLSAPQKKTEMT